MKCPIIVVKFVTVRIVLEEMAFRFQASQAVLVVKNLPAMQETQETGVQSLGREDPLEDGMTTHSNILAWRIPWAEETGGLWFMGSQRVGYN